MLLLEMESGLYVRNLETRQPADGVACVMGVAVEKLTPRKVLRKLCARKPYNRRSRVV